MNVLYIADPSSIHDVRWIQAFSQSGIGCYIIPRKLHYILNPKQPTFFHILKPIPDPSVINPLKELAGAFYLTTIIRKYKIDLVHIMYAEPNALWARYKRYLKVPIVITTRGSDVLRTIPAFSSGKGWLNAQVANRYKKAFELADLVTCTSSSQQLAVDSINKAALKKTILVRTGVDIEAISNANQNVAKQYNIQKPFLLMPRNMKPVYNHEFTLKAISQLPEEVRKDYSFVFVNADSADKAYCNKIKKLAAAIVADIYFLPTLSHTEILSLYKQAELAVMNPFSDGSPVSAMEAMASKLPVILGPLNYDQQLFRGTTFLLKNWNSEELSQTICMVLSLAPEEKSALTKRALDIISNYADSKTEMAKIVVAYQGLCN